MDIHVKLKDISQALLELNQTQTHICRRLGSDKDELSISDRTIQQSKKFEKLISNLGAQFGKHYSALKETTKLVLILLDHVGQISRAVQNLQSSIKTGESSSGYKGKRFVPKQSHTNTQQLSSQTLESFESDEGGSYDLDNDGIGVKYYKTRLDASSKIKNSNKDFERVRTKTPSMTVKIKRKSHPVLSTAPDRNLKGNGRSSVTDSHSESDNLVLFDTKETTRHNKVLQSYTRDKENISNINKNDIEADGEQLLTKSEEGINSEQCVPNRDIAEQSISGTDNCIENHNTDESIDLNNRSLEMSNEQEKCTADFSRVEDSFNEYNDLGCSISESSMPKKEELKLKQNISNRMTIVCKNEFGYKQKQSEMWSDNRVTFHCKDQCFEGLQVKSPQHPPELFLSETINDPPNIQSEHQIPGRMQTRRQQEFGQYQANAMTSDCFEKPRTVREWLSYAEQVRINSLAKMQNGSIQRGGHGHDSIIVLDCSERMKGRKFKMMIEAAKEYVQGIQQVKMTRLLEDNIGLAVFGGNSRLILESTCDYESVLHQISLLRPEGEAPLVGGFLLGLAGVLGGSTSQILENEAPGHMIVFTDELSAKVSVEQDLEINPSYLTGDVLRTAAASGVIKQIANHNIRIFYVPVGQDDVHNDHNPVMETAVMETNGKIIRLNEMHRLIRMTQVLILAAQVASDMRFTNPKPSRDDVHNKIVERYRQEDANEDSIDMVLDFLNPFGTDKRRGIYCELNCKSLWLGARVRRGPQWWFENQDSGLPGTVIGQDNMRNVWVEWDSGHGNVYVFDEINSVYSIIQVQEPQIVIDEMVAVGCRVTRGNDWTFDNDDGGPGSFGTVLNVKPDATVIVRWDCRKVGLYKMGNNGLFEVKLCDDPYSSPSKSLPSESTQNHTTSPAGKCPRIGTHTDQIENYRIDMNVNAVWEFKRDNWIEFSSQINARLEKAYEKKPAGRTNIKIENQNFVIDFNSMTQENVVTKEKIKVRRRLR